MILPALQTQRKPVTSFLLLARFAISKSPRKPSLGDVVTRDAFYKIRFAIAATQPVHYTSINPDSKLESLFPRKGRKQTSGVSKALGIDVDLLAVKRFARVGHYIKRPRELYHPVLYLERRCRMFCILRL